HFCHPYTQALLSAAPSFDPRKRNNDKRIILQGDLPSPANPPSGCRFHTRCPYATERCAKEVPKIYEVEPGHEVRCHFAMDYAKKGF
ncbi:oligopeptide/dipeptide ABC transporter ATP-binding protein, partial [Lactimicrobium sp.]